MHAGAPTTLPPRVTWRRASRWRASSATRPLRGTRRDLAACLELIAAVCAADQARHVCRLLGAAEVLRETQGTALPPSERDLVEQAAIRAREGLDQVEAAAEWQAGRSWSLAEAV